MMPKPVPRKRIPPKTTPPKTSSKKKKAKKEAPTKTPTKKLHLPRHPPRSPKEISQEELPPDLQHLYDLLPMPVIMEAEQTAPERTPETAPVMAPEMTLQTDPVMASLTAPEEPEGIIDIPITKRNGNKRTGAKRPSPGTPRTRSHRSMPARRKVKLIIVKRLPSAESVAVKGHQAAAKPLEAAGTPRTGTPRTGTPRVGTPRDGVPREGTPHQPDVEAILHEVVQTVPKMLQQAKAKQLMVDHM
ncbi:protein IQ-DOMAIN 14-like, partial [Haliotis rubra]|uniref:protein IQ-DOMAIN 14-like n=1 Tax=Haliotis rubra TaxID=36100 RepID=UPI001EE54334